jgi:hypothetical protein
MSNPARIMIAPGAEAYTFWTSEFVVTWSERGGLRKQAR